VREAAKNMRGKLALFPRILGCLGHSLRIFLNSAYEPKVVLFPFNATYRISLFPSPVAEKVVSVAAVGAAESGSLRVAVWNMG
jgi:hypothetical protein